jgi:predicted nucleic acid-binding protein
MDKPLYVLDSNVLIDAHRRYYAFDLAPKFWDSLIMHSEENRICSIDKVKDELAKGNDAHWKWANDHFLNAFHSTDEDEVQKVYRSLMGWANANERYAPAAKAEFASVADAWLIAYAKAKNYILVTDEKIAESAQRRIPIPNVCKEFNVPYIGTFEMLRKLGVKFD